MTENKKHLKPDSLKAADRLAENGSRIDKRNIRRAKQFCRFLQETHGKTPVFFTSIVQFRTHKTVKDIRILWYIFHFIFFLAVHNLSKNTIWKPFTCFCVPRQQFRVSYRNYAHYSP